ncbi:fatty acid synthase alpha subunit Lsd1 [Stygiomarasmius scandens]|uniref:Fatty acid synthase alpha subunit Lsd1 n=1 Tax=Marasmiellus scandens TaxID=2682957 RepID=A0ABR1JP34_9AGAR
MLCSVVRAPTRFDELQTLYDIYRPFVEPFISITSSGVLVSFAVERKHTTFYTYGMDVASWLSGASSVPSTPYLTSIPLSLPLISLTRLVQYLHVTKLSPSELAECIAEATGH